ncbi:MAG: isoprenylcysteine carboxylmethyltransferase family protein [Imperialibacter sp.]|uniref:methyltransferase family protein n=1 Tax=Imperialibacter sp. TaxID=2038411 RepID=UPI0032EF8F38
MEGLILVSLFWVLYFSLHSFLAADFVKRRFNRQWFRLFYNTVAMLLLLAIVFYMATVDSPFVFGKTPVTDFFAFSLAAYGVIIIRLSFRQFSLGAFLGLKREVEDIEFKSEGILERVRHPIYSGTILLCLGFLLYIPKMINLVTVVWIFAYLPIGIWLEEKKLIKKYGRDYEEYRSRVPAVFPKLF